MKRMSLAVVVGSVVVGTGLLACKTTNTAGGGSAGGGSILASISGPDEFKAEMRRGTFKLWCGGAEQGTATATGTSDDLKFSTAAKVADGTSCWIGLTIAGDHSKFKFFGKDQLYYTSAKANVTGAKLKVDMYKSYASKDDTIIIGQGGSKVLLTVVLMNEKNEKLPLIRDAKFAANLDCGAKYSTSNMQGTVNEPTIVFGFDVAVTDAQCLVSVLNTGTNVQYTTDVKIPFAAAMGTKDAPINLKVFTVVDKNVEVDVNFKGVCRAFDEGGTCVFVLPESCMVPMGERKGTFTATLWLDCVNEVAGIMRRDLSKETPGQQQQQGSSTPAALAKFKEAITALVDLGEKDFKARVAGLAKDVSDYAPSQISVKAGREVLLKVLADLSSK